MPLPKWKPISTPIICLNCFNLYSELNKAPKQTPAISLSSSFWTSLLSLIPSVTPSSSPASRQPSTSLDAHSPGFTNKTNHRQFIHINHYSCSSDPLSPRVCLVPYSSASPKQYHPSPWTTIPLLCRQHSALHFHWLHTPCYTGHTHHKSSDQPSLTSDCAISHKLVIAGWAVVEIWKNFILSLVSN